MGRVWDGMWDNEMVVGLGVELEKVVKERRGGEKRGVV